MRRFAVAVAGSLMTGIYWWIIFMIVYGNVLFAGDRGPARAPRPDHAVLVTNSVTVIVGILLYAGLSMLWRRLTTGLLDSSRT